VSVRTDGMAGAAVRLIRTWDTLLGGAAASFANTVIKPRVTEMDESMTMSPEVIKGLFSQGVRPRACVDNVASVCRQLTVDVRRSLSRS
jgi:hypothetical protein